jgi:site-specific DNA-methyltransferase (adenine-specific)
MEINKIYNIDCLEGLRKLSDKSINHVFTSPPYNRKRNDKYHYHNDNIDNYFEWLCNVIDECLRVSSGYVFFNIMKNYYNKKDVYLLFGKYSEIIQEVIIWEKTNPLPANGNNITNSFEYFIIFGNKPLKSNFTYTKNIISTAVNSNMANEHKAIMKQDVSDWFIKNFTNENDIILDCFMGSGTTAISCKYYNRNYIGFELQKEYIKLSEKRIYDSLGLFS